MNKPTARLYDGSGTLARRLGTWALSGGIGAVTLRAGAAIVTAPAILTEAHRQPLTMPAIGAAWTWAAWRAARPSPTEPDPTPTDTPTAPTCDDSDPEGAPTATGEGFTIIDVPGQPNASRVIWKDTP